MSYIEFKNVSFSYPDGTKAVDNISFHIKKGEKVAIIGQNGSGKTTTAKLMNGLFKPTNGDVLIDGKNSKDYTTAKLSKNVGYVFQNPDDQIFNKDVITEIEYSPRYFKLSEKEIKNKVSRAVKLTSIHKYLNENPYNLPYSLRKFVTIAAVLAIESEAIILDEPTAGQDTRGMEQISYLVDELAKEGKTVITITHDMDFVVKNFDRIIVMANKRIVHDGTKNEIFYDDDLLKISYLKKPPITELACDLEMQNPIFTIEDFIDELKGLDTI